MRSVRTGDTRGSHLRIDLDWRDPSGEVPEWLKGTDCKSVGFAYVGSNPTLSTIFNASSIVFPSYRAIIRPSIANRWCAVRRDRPAIMDAHGG